MDTPATAAEGASPRDPPDQELILATLEKVLSSSAFRLSDRGKRFLRYVVVEALAGRADRIKAYTIATEVFGRKDDFDATNDPIVRIEAGRLRRALDLYYLSAGALDPVRIELHKGSYVPRFEVSASSPATEDAPGSPPMAAWLRALRSRKMAILLVSLLAVVAAETLFLERFAYLSLEAPGDSRSALSMRGPIVEVRPLEVLSLDPDDQLLGRSLGSELVRSLSQFGDLRIFENTFGLSGVPVAFTIDGDLARDGDRLRVNVRLSNVTTHEILWSQSYSRTVSAGSMLDLEAEITAEIAMQIAQPSGAVPRQTVALLRNEAPQSMATYLCMQRAYEYRRLFAAGHSYPEVRECLGEAVQREPDYPDAWAMLAFLQLEGWQFGFVSGSAREEEFEASLKSASRAYDLDPNNVLSLEALSAALFFRGQHERAEELLRVALAKNPNLPDTNAQLGWRLIMVGRRDEGRKHMQTAIDRSVMPPRWYYLITSLDGFMRGNYRSAVDDARIAESGCCGLGRLLAALAEAELGDVEEARKDFAQAAAEAPALGQNPLKIFRIHQANAEILDAIAAALQKIGVIVPPLPDRPADPQFSGR